MSTERRILCLKALLTLPLVEKLFRTCDFLLTVHLAVLHKTKQARASAAHGRPRNTQVHSQQGFASKALRKNMAKVEKFVVLTVLFVIAVVLVVSLSGDNPLDKDNAAKLGEKPQAKPAEATGTQGGSPLLSVNVQPEAAAATPTPAQNPAQAAAQPVPAPAAPAATIPAVTLPSGALLKTTEGLSPSFDDKRLFYRWQQGDGWVKLAERLYGNGAKFSLLKNANEGRDDIQPGEQILVPIFDVESMAAAPATAAPAEPAASKPATAGDKKSSKKAALVSTGGKVHEVKKGESLWKIAKSELGDGNRWKEIYELNKDQMKSPEAVRLGMKLKLP
ncbi:MAG: hypothetical protein RL277_2462 [Planctomycetota bacterium]